MKLTKYSHGAGCGCKISPQKLNIILHNSRTSINDKKILVGNSSNDDAAAYDMGNGQALISTTDFFMPIVDDAFDFGRIAAANALSDVYAMGGSPILALAILGWPIEKLDATIAQQVIAGARSICDEAEITIAGGHSIDSPEPIFGLSVNGIVEIKNLKQNNTAQPGDSLYLTKPLGAGIITTAAKRGQCDEADLKQAIKWMTTLNKIGFELGTMSGVHALTDVTGFGLCGHLIEMAEGSDCSAEINFNLLPLMKNLTTYLSKSIYPDMTMKNYSAFSDKLSELDANQIFVLCDPQTSGGLLVAVSADAEADYLKLVAQNNLKGIADIKIGTITEKQDKIIVIK